MACALASIPFPPPFANCAISVVEGFLRAAFRVLYIMNRPAPNAASPVTPKDTPMPIPAAAPPEIPLPPDAEQLEFPVTTWFANASATEASQLFALFVADPVGVANIQPFTGIADTAVSAVTLELVIFQSGFL